MDIEIYRQRLAALREENEFLRQAAHAFGELAERLAQELRDVRAQAERAEHRSPRQRGSWNGSGAVRGTSQHESAPRR
jgi:hypothetical protein